MSVPKRKHQELERPARATTKRTARPSRAEREAAEMRDDVEAFDRAMAAWKADGHRTVPHAEIKRRFGMK